MPVWVIFRPVEDTVLDSRGVCWIDTLRGYPVDPSVHPHGGIVLTEWRASGDVIRENRTFVQSYTAEGRPVIGTEVIVHKHKVLHIEDGECGEKTYICEPIEEDAKYLAALRGWTYAMYNKAEDIPRRQGVAPAVVDVEAAFAATDAERERLKQETVALMARGSPPIKLSVKTDKLKDYVDLWRPKQAPKPVEKPNESA